MRPELYIHIPFCARKCEYCDFASWAGCEDRWQEYFDALNAELDAWMEKTGGSFSTAFFGGGTPSLVPARYIAELAKKVRADEFTIEANPGTLDPEKLAAYREAGINRLSMGVQSFDDALLKRIGRIHDSATAKDSFAMARAAGFDNINIDLMYALPGQTMDSWTSTLETALELSPEHISAYSLIIEEGTPISRWAQPIDDDTVNAMQRTAQEILSRGGYSRYEISNYAKPGYECRHNLGYWRRDDYIGIGCAAHSLFANTRFSNPASLDEYLSGTRRVDVEALSPADIAEETVMLGLRMAEGIDMKAVPDQRVARRLAEAGFASIEDGRFMLTQRGMEVQDAIVIELIT